VSTAVGGTPAVAPFGSTIDHSHSRVAAAALDARGVGDRGTAGSSRSDTCRDKMDEAGLAAAVAAASSTHAKAPPFAGPTGFRAWGAEVAIWLRLTSVPPNKQAATLTAAMTGVAKRLALRLPPDVMFGDTGVDSLMSLLRSRFGDAGGTTSKVAFDGLRSCTRGNSTMQEYLVSLDEAVALCEEADCTLSDAMQTHVVVDQANLSSAEQSMALSTASTGTDAPVTYLAITRAPLLLYGGKAKKTDVALLAQPRPSRAPRPPRKPPGGGGDPGSGAAAESACWYCKKAGHTKRDCRMRVKHLRERGITVEDAGGGGSNDDPPAAAVIHMVVLTGTTGSSWEVPAGEVIVDSGATATVVGDDWVTAFLL